MRLLAYLFISLSTWIILICDGGTDGSGLIKSDDKLLYSETLSGIPGSWSEIVYPVQVRNGEALSNLDTRDHKSKQKHHFHSTNFEINLLSKKHRIKLELNRELLSNGFKLKYNQNAKVQVVEEMSVENCFYQGQIRRETDSLVVLSTCNGLRGVIVLSNHVYVIQPLPQTNNASETARFPHIVYRSVPDTNLTCANDRGMWVSYKDLHHGDFLRNLKIMKLDGDSVLTETKYMRTALVVDNTMYSRLNRSLHDTLHFVGLIVNIADALMNDANVKIKMRLVYVELWNQHDLFDVSSNARQALTGFLRYRKDTLTHVHFNYAHFISGRHFDSNEIGMAIADSVCSDNAVAVSKSESVHDIWQSAFGIVHMLAHSLGVNHDATEHCMCSDPTSSCIMSQSSFFLKSSLARSWSTCSIKDIHTSIRSRLSGCLSTANNTSGGTVDQQEMMYRQTCGNGITERGEECDCQNTEECELLDPCCDAKTCLLKPWATCRHGNCCHNCTVRPSNQMCRSAVGECDVPEFCDGLSGHCPRNTLTQDGQVCGDENGFCYQGICRTYSNQCQSLWGLTAVAADDKCYDTFNTAGRFNGHCGHNGTSTDYMKCSIENTKCGLLHCSGGSEKPLIGQNQTFSKTVVYSDGKEYECKIVNGALDGDHRSSKTRVGMVQDGSRCGHGAVCIGAECVALSHVMPAKCVVGSNGAMCSGHGVCTTDLRCYCSDGWAGISCSERSNVTIIPLPTSTTEIVPPTSIPEEDLVNITDNITTSSGSTLLAGVTPSGSKADTASTVWLLIVLVVVVGVAVVLLAFCLLCYRRRSPLSQNKKKPVKNHKHSTFGNLSSFGSSNYSKQQEIMRLSPVNSVVKFGKTPSWKAEKMKRAMKQQRESGASETGSADRDSTEFKQVPSLPPADPPERGILKKCSSRSSVDGARRTRSTSQSSLASHAASAKASTVELLPSLTVLSDGKRLTDEQLDRGEDEDQCSYCDCSAEEDVESVRDEDDEGADDSKSGCNQETQTDLDSPSSSMSRTSIYSESGSKLARLSNINELLRQIDEQFNSVLRATTATTDLSPTNSEEFRGSETEADRACGGFYRQTDADVKCPGVGTKLLAAPQKRDGLGLNHSPQSSFSVVSNSGPPGPVPDKEMSSRSSFKPLALPAIPKLLEFGCSPEGEADVRWRPQAFVPYRGLSTASEVSIDPQRWNSPGLSGSLPLCPVASSSPATVPSEGYHSDRGGPGSEIDTPIILREIPRQSSNALQLASAKVACHSTALSSELLHSPEDVDV